MASIQKLGKGKQPLRAIDFTDPLSKKRKRIRLGVVSHDFAVECKRRIERLVAAKSLNHPDPETSHWLTGIAAEIHNRISKQGLCPPRVKPPETPTLREWIDRYLSERSDLKLASRKRLQLTVDRLVECFGENIPIGDITLSHAHEWRATLYTPKTTTAEKSRLSEATVRTHCRNAKILFRAAVERELIAKNPFAGLKSAVIAADREGSYVTPEQTKAILEVASLPWRVLIALCRFAGLRCCSETHGLTWGNVDLERRRLVVYAPKTDDLRAVPIVPELFEILNEAYANAAGSPDSVPPPSTNVVTLPENNRHRQLKAILERVGITPWGDLFQALRRSAESDFARFAPQHAVSGWIGHSMEVSARHYLMTTDDIFKAASSRPLLGAMQSASQSASAEPGTIQQEPENGWNTVDEHNGNGDTKPVVLHRLAKDCLSTPERIRTSDRRIRNPLLYPTELRARGVCHGSCAMTDDFSCYQTLESTPWFGTRFIRTSRLPATP